MTEQQAAELLIRLAELVEELRLIARLAEDLLAERERRSGSAQR